MKRFIIVSVFFVYLLPASVWAEKIILSALGDFKPFQYEENGKVTGIDADMVREACKRLGIEPEFRVMPWKRALVSAEKGRVDGMLAALHTKERESFLHFTKESIHVQKNVIMARKGGGLKINGLDDLKGKKMGVIRDFSYGPEFDSHKGFGKDVCDTQQDLIRVLDKGRIEVAAGSELPFLFNSREMGLQGRFEIVYVITEYQAFTVLSKKAMGEKGKTLAEKFDKAYRQIKDEGLEQRFIDRYVK